MKILFSLFCIVLLPLTATGIELRSTLEDQQQVAVTIYDSDLALVRDQRSVDLPKGQTELAFRDVSAQIKPETVIFRNLTDPHGTIIREQNFDFDLLSPQKLLEKYVGKDVMVVRSHPQTGADTSVSAKVLAANSGVVLQIGDKIETGVPGRIVYPDVPQNLRDRPTLLLDLENARSGQQDLELSYLTGGLSWKADYVALLARDEKNIDLSGWVTLTNKAGTTFRQATLQLVAGDVNLVPTEQPRARDFMMKTAMAEAAPAMAEEGLFEYHLYTLQRPTTIKDNQTKQVALLNAPQVQVKKDYLLKGTSYYYRGPYSDLGRKIKVATFLEFANKKDDGLGMPLPKGVIRVYQQDSRGMTQFIGEDRIDHTPKNETVRLKLGEAFDLTADRTQTDFLKLSGKNEPLLAESAYQIVLKNAKETPVTIRVQEPIPGEWKILQENHKHSRIDANTAEWNISVPADSSATLTYRVRVKQ